MSIVIDVVKNGFVVRPFIPERHAVAKDEATVVFETHESLFEYLEKTCVINIDASQE